MKTKAVLWCNLSNELFVCRVCPSRQPTNFRTCGLIFFCMHSFLSFYITYNQRKRRSQRVCLARKSILGISWRWDEANRQQKKPKSTFMKLASRMPAFCQSKTTKPTMINLFSGSANVNGMLFRLVGGSITFRPVFFSLIELKEVA